MAELIIYFTSLVLFFILVFKVLRAINIENIFKSDRIFEIKAFYFIVSIAVAHILSEVILKLYSWMMIFLQ